MQVRRHASVRSFLDTAGGFLLRHEREYFLILGFSTELAAEESIGDALLVTLEDDGEPIAAAVRCPPHPLILTRLPAAAADGLVENLAADLARGDGAIVNVIAPEGSAERFAEHWTRATSTRSRPGVRQRAFRLERVASDLRPCSGRLRQAGEADVERIAAWIEAFADEVGMGQGPPLRTAEAKVAQGAFYLWDDDHETVTMAAWAGPTPNGIRVNFVYTPPELRGRGYASACVAALSQRLLDEGRRYCFLFTDLANPTSNNIYQRIGYRPVYDVHEYWFDSQTRESRGVTNSQP